MPLEVREGSDRLRICMQGEHTGTAPWRSEHEGQNRHPTAPYRLAWMPDAMENLSETRHS
eukprot:4693419-Pleurochrysis_carterae.AAC.3